MTVHSDWGDWLPRAIADHEPDGVAIWYLGCNGFVLKANDGTTVFVDPYLGTGDPPRTVRMIPVPFAPGDVESADAILTTHEHTDHVHGPSQAPILAGTDASFYGGDASVAVATDEGWAERWNVAPERFVTVTEGEAFSVGSFDVAVEAAHDPDAIHPVSYVVQHDAGTFFHGGDTKPHESLADIGDRYTIDLGAVALGCEGMIPDRERGQAERTRWYADENGVVEIANALRLDRLLPSHWDMWKGLTVDPTGLYSHVRTFEHPERLEIVEIGDRVSL